MELSRWLASAILLVAWPVSVRADWYLDYSCYDQAKQIQRSMSSAFDLATSGSQALSDVVQPLQSTATKAQKQARQAQVDLVDYLFKEMMNGKSVNKDTAGYKTATTMLQQIQVFKNFKGIVYSVQREFIDSMIAIVQKKSYDKPTLPSDVKMLPLDEYMKKDNVFVYCDGSRYGEKDIGCGGHPQAKTPAEKDTTYFCNKALGALIIESENKRRCLSASDKIILVCGTSSMVNLRMLMIRCKL